MNSQPKDDSLIPDENKTTGDHGSLTKDKTLNSSKNSLSKEFDKLPVSELSNNNNDKMAILLYDKVSAVGSNHRPIEFNEKQISQLNFFQICKTFPLPNEFSRIPTKEYIDAVITLADFISKLGMAFWSVRMDILNNIDKVNEVYSKSSEECIFLDILIEKEKNQINKDNWFGWESINPPTSTYVNLTTDALEALLWVHRSMSFFGQILCKLISDYDNKTEHEEIVDYFSQAYCTFIEPHASWLMGIFFKMFIASAPKRSRFLNAARGIGVNQLNEEQIFDKIRPYVKTLQACNETLHKCFIQEGYKP